MLVDHLALCLERLVELEYLRVRFIQSIARAPPWLERVNQALGSLTAHLVRLLSSYLSFLFNFVPVVSFRRLLEARRRPYC